MSKEDLKKFVPDTPEEWAFIGTSVNRLGAAMTTVGALKGNITWVLVSVGFTWLGLELSGYFSLYLKKKKDNDPAV